MVNVTDVDQSLPEWVPGNDRLDLIFQEQHKLIEKYHPIEDKSALMHTRLCPVAIDDRFGQARLKDFAWRITEELTEYTTATEGQQHAHEELGDVCHFLIELIILSNLNPIKLVSKEFFKTEPHLNCKLEWCFNRIQDDHHYVGKIDATYRVIESLGLAMNCLKQKPWKQTHIATDIKKYNKYITWTWNCFIRLCIEEHITPHQLFRLYFLKNKVNQFRINSKY